MPVLADQSLYTGSERSFYRVLHAYGQAHRRGRATPPQELGGDIRGVVQTPAPA
jgi:putative transposase